MKKILITGCAGFIGSSVVVKLLKKKIQIIGVDNLNEYYDVQLKKDRLNFIQDYAKDLSTNFSFYPIDISDRNKIVKLFANTKPNSVIHLAAQAGVRYSVSNPFSYIDSNILGFANVIEGSRSSVVDHFVYASSSSVYGGRISTPFYESDSVDKPINLYAATKKSNELIAHSYSHIYNLPTTGLRFFTVYGPWGRPDMSSFIFTNAILNDKPIPLFNNGNMWRDFTYIDDIVECIIRVVDEPPNRRESSDSLKDLPYKIFNVGNSSPIKITDFISVLESTLQKRARLDFLPMQAGDATITYSDTTKIKEWINFSPYTPIEQGVKKFIDWYKKYYKI